MENRFITVVFILILISASSCKEKRTINEASGNFESLVNTSHLDALYEEIIVEKDTMGIIHIYSEYPDYGWIAFEVMGYGKSGKMSRYLWIVIKLRPRVLAISETV